MDINFGIDFKGGKEIYVVCYFEEQCDSIFVGLVWFSVELW